MTDYVRAGGTAAAAIAALALVGCQPPAPKAPAVDTSKVADEVKAAIHTQVEAYAARDAAKASSIVAPDILAMFHGAPNVVGKAESEAASKAQMADPAVKLEVSDETVDVAASGDLAVYHATYRFTFTNPETKQPASETGNWLAVFRRQPDGTMKLSRDAVLDLPAAASGGAK